MLKQICRWSLTGGLALALLAALAFPIAARARHTPPQEKSKSRIPNPFAAARIKIRTTRRVLTSYRSGARVSEDQGRSARISSSRDADFRDEVEEAYVQKKREHSEYAFSINTRRASDKLVTDENDKLKIRETLYDNPLVQGLCQPRRAVAGAEEFHQAVCLKVLSTRFRRRARSRPARFNISSGLLSLI